MTRVVALIPGVGFGGSEFGLLARHLRRQGFTVYVFPHSPGRIALSQSAEKLKVWLESQGVAEAHFVAHSLGGHVLLRYLTQNPDFTVGRVMLLGTPLNGCLAARRVSRWPGGRIVIGEGLSSVSEAEDRTYPEGIEVGMIAGRWNFLLGLLLCPGKANDTLVCVEETRHPTLTAHLALPVTHSSMLLSRKVAYYTATFLESGAFPAKPE